MTMTYPGGKEYTSASGQTDKYMTVPGPLADATDAVRVSELRKEYGAIRALDGIDLAIHKKEMFGVIGADGAGKTSLFNILTGILTPTSGRVEVLGGDPKQTRFHVGYLTQRFSLNLELSVMENIAYVGGLRAVSAEDIDARAQKYLALMGMSRFGDRLAGNLSGGMKQKLALCASLVSRPRLLLLDEPTTGVDPVSRREFWDILAQIRSEGVTVVVATPYMDEAERCTRVALFDEGKVIAIGSPAELSQSTHLKKLIVRSANIIGLAHSLEKCQEQDLKSVELFGDHIDVLCSDPDAGTRIVSKCAQQSQINDVSVSTAVPSLGNVFQLSQKQKAESARYRPYPFQISKVAPKRGDAIYAHELQKTFGTFRAVKGVDIQVKYGQIYGLLGANGAGKTTCIKMLCGLITSTAGTMQLAGREHDLRDKSLRAEIGYMSQKFTLYEDLSLIENLRFYGGAYRIPRHLLQDRIDWVLETTGLKGNETLITRELPGGWKQRLSLGAAVLHQPSILFLDEPTSGVDPIARQQMWRLISEFAKHNTAVLVTTHFLEEAEYCHQLGLMVDGEMAASGTPGQIKQSQPGVLLQLTTDKAQQLYQELKTKFDPWKVSLFGSSLHIVLDHPEQELSILDSVASAAGAQVLSREQIPFALEDAFIGIVMRKQAQR